MSTDADGGGTGAQQGPPAPPHPNHMGFILEAWKTREIVSVLNSFTANGNLADYDSSLANRVHDAVEVVELAPKLLEILLKEMAAGNLHTTMRIDRALKQLQIDAMYFTKPGVNT